jgi:hypothetical protein
MVLLSVVMATQFATTRVVYSYGIVHPSNADIRFVGSDNSSDDEPRALRVTNNASGSRALIINLGNQSLGDTKNYTAAFAIVNEEQFPVTITSINVSGNGSSFITVWLHANHTTEAALEATSARYLMVNNGVSQTNDTATAWVLAAGNGDPSNMNGTAIQTPWDETAHVRYNATTTIYAQNGTRDWVWVQICITLPMATTINPPFAGFICIHFKATTH